VQAGKVAQPDALKVIRGVRQRVDKVRGLLRALGDGEETLALSQRVRRMSKRFRKAESDPQLVELYGRLTVAYHELSVVLQSSFFPGQ
jgi:hypothetical protein